MSSVEDMVSSFFLMFILLFIAVIILIGLMLPWDSLDPVFKSAGMENVAVTWNTFDDRDFLIDIIYAVDFFLFILAPAQFIFTCVKRQEYDQYVR